MSNRVSGFAIPAAVFVIVIVSLLALGGLYVAQSNAAASNGTRLSLKAFYAANAGAEQVLATWKRRAYLTMAPGDSLDTNWQSLRGGAEYRTSVLRVDDGTDVDYAVYRLRTVGRPGPGRTAQRVLMTMVDAKRATAACCESAMKLQGQLRIQGTGGTVKVSGLDVPPPGWGGFCPAPSSDLAGIDMADLSELQINGLPVLEGTPPILEDPSIDEDDFSMFGDISYDQLADIADKRFLGNQTIPNISPATSGGECRTAVETNWGDPVAPGNPCSGYLPIVHINGDLRLTGSGVGQGILLVDGNLEVSGIFQYNGIVIVKGDLDLNGTTQINGGLLVQNGDGTYRSVLRGDTTLQYSSCAISRSVATAVVTRPLAGRYWFEVLQ